MVEIIYLDIDGTLRDEQKGVPDSAAWTIGQCRKYGIRIVICTGRSSGMVQEDVMALQTDGMISGGGCYIQYRGREVLRKCFDVETVKKAFALIPHLRLSLSVETEKHIFMDRNASVFYWNDFRRRIGASRKTQKEVWIQNKIFYEDNFQDLKKDVNGIHKICIFGGRRGVDEAEKRVVGEAQLIQKRKWNGRWYLELLPKGCNKGTAVYRLNKELGILKSRSMSFGDGVNDIDMMKATGVAVAVGSGDMRIRKYASSVCEAAAEDGIYKELVRRNIIHPWERSAVL